MSGAFPISNSKFETMGIKSIQNTIISKSQSGKKLARQIDGQRFGFTARIITAKRSDVYGELMAFIIKQRSGKENFTIIPPEVEDARGTDSSKPVAVTFNINTLDASGFDELLIRNRGTITSIINSAVNERGSKNLI